MIVGAQEHLFDDPDLWRGGYCPNIIIFTNMYSDISISVCALKFNSEASTSTLLKRTNAFICIYVVLRGYFIEIIGCMRLTRGTTNTAFKL